MLFQRIVSSFFAAASLTVYPFSLAVAGEYSAKHGGIHIENKVMNMEVVVKPEMIQVYTTDHGKPLKLEGAKAKVTLLNGSEKSEVDLSVVGDKFEAKGAFKVAKGTRGIALVTLAGKPGTTARFTVQ